MISQRDLSLDAHFVIFIAVTTKRHISLQLDEIMSAAGLTAAKNIRALSVRLQREQAHVEPEDVLAEVVAGAERDLAVGVENALARLVHLFDGRPRKWYWSHEYLIGAYDFMHEETATGLIQSLGSQELFECEIKAGWDRQKLLMHSKIRSHEAGWTSPKPKPWHERKWFLAKIVDWALPFAMGSVATLALQQLTG